MNGWFQTRTSVESADAELRQRRIAARDCQRSELRLYLTVTALSQGITVLLAQTGAAAAWMTPLCLAPGAALLLLAGLCKRLTGAPTLTESFRAGLCPAFARLWQGYIALLLLWQGEAALTEVVCLFTEGVVTRVTPLALAAATLLAALCCCRQMGLPRCVWLLRFPMMALFTLLFFDLADKGRIDHFLPLIGGGGAVNQTLFLRMNALGWPLLLFCDLPPREQGQRRGSGPLPAALAAALLVAAAVFAMPTELALTAKNLADAMLLPTVFLTPLNRLLALTGWTVGLLLALAISLRRGAELTRALAPLRRETLLFFLLALLLYLPHFAGEHDLRAALKAVQPWLLAPGAVLLALLLPGAALCQRRGRKRNA